MTANYATFRQDLDAVLRQRDPHALREFMIASNQWPPETTMDPEAALWMMIAASPNLKDLHPEARAWLEAHGRSGEADAILQRGQGGARPMSKGTKPSRKQTTPRKP